MKITMNKNNRTLTAKFLDAEPRVLLELTNDTELTLRSVEILTIFLKSEEHGAPSEAHIRFEPIKSMHPQQTAVVGHRTWIDGKPARDERDQMARLKLIPGELNPYVLNISWQDAEGKARFQRIPVGH
jgi:hypothetical protein